MDKIRTFTAIELPLRLKDEIEEYIKALRKVSRGIKWVKTDNLHITLKFIGERSPALTEVVKSALDTVDYTDGLFSIEAAKIGAFPNKRRPRVVWIALNDTPHSALHNLFKAIDIKLQGVGIEKEKRPFSAHLTIGRVKFDEDFGRFWDYTENRPFTSSSFPVKDFSLIKSVLDPHGSQYTVLKKYSLQ